MNSHKEVQLVLPFQYYDGTNPSGDGDLAELVLTLLQTGIKIIIFRTRPFLIMIDKHISR